jgi:hypothetical protein
MGGVQVESMTKEQTAGHYPAPFAILDCIKYGFRWEAHDVTRAAQRPPCPLGPLLSYRSHNRADSLAYEATRFAELAATSVSASLRGIFTGRSKGHSRSLHAFSCEDCGRGLTWACVCVCVGPRHHGAEAEQVRGPAQEDTDDRRARGGPHGRR